jgi:hypothetical protein
MNGGGSVCVLPLADAGGAVGALVLESSREDRFDADTLELCDAVAALVGPVMQLQRANSRPMWRRALDAGRATLGRFVGPGHLAWKVVGIGVLSLLLALTFVQGEYRVTADAVLEGRVLRAAVAPFDGYIDAAEVKAGLECGIVIAGYNDVKPGDVIEFFTTEKVKETMKGFLDLTKPEDTVQVVTKFKGKPLFREVIQAIADRFRSGSGTLRLVDVKTVMFEFRPYCDMKWSSVTQYAAAYMNWMLGRGYVTRPKKGTYVWVPPSKRDIPLRPGEHLDEKDWEDMRKAGLV